MAPLKIKWTESEEFSKNRYMLVSGTSTFVKLCFMLIIKPLSWASQSRASKSFKKNFVILKRPSEDLKGPYEKLREAL